MAVSNAVGSNVFDILVCLGLPWFLKTAIIKPGSYVKVFSKGEFTTIYSTTFFLISSTLFVFKTIRSISRVFHIIIIRYLYPHKLLAPWDIFPGLTYSTLTLLSTVVFLIVITHMNGWKMDRKYGITLMLWYVFFICFASLYELNVFGNLNPPECSTEY